MKINFKTILIIFLVALLGSGLGTYGVLAFYKSDSKNSVLNQDSNVVINEVQYTNMEKSDYTKAIDKAFNTVVEIKCQVQTTTASDFFFFGGTTTSTSAGSGVIFSNDGYIVTNAHVIEGLVDESTLQVKIYTGDIFNAKVIGYDSRTDLAVIKIDADDLPYSSFANCVPAAAYLTSTAIWSVSSMPRSHRLPLAHRQLKEWLMPYHPIPLSRSLTI